MGVAAATIHFETSLEALLGQMKAFLGMRGYRVEKEGYLATAGQLPVDAEFAAQAVKNIRQKRTRHFVIMPDLKGWLTLVEDGCQALADQDLASSLAGRLGCRVAYLVVNEETRSLLYALYDGGDDVESLWMVEGNITEHHGLGDEVTGAADLRAALKMRVGQLGLRRVPYRYEDFNDPGFAPAGTEVAQCWHLSMRRMAGVTETQQVHSMAGSEEEQAVRARAEEFYRRYTLSDARGMYKMEVPVVAMVGELNTLDKYIQAVKQRMPRADEVRIEEVTFEDPEFRQAKLNCTFLKDGQTVRSKYESWQKGALYAFMPKLKPTDHNTWFHNIQAKGEYE